MKSQGEHWGGCSFGLFGNHSNYVSGRVIGQIWGGIRICDYGLVCRGHVVAPADVSLFCTWWDTSKKLPRIVHPYIDCLAVKNIRRKATSVDMFFNFFV